MVDDEVEVSMKMVNSLLDELFLESGIRRFGSLSSSLLDTVSKVDVLSSSIDCFVDGLRRETDAMSSRRKVDASRRANSPP